MSFGEALRAYTNLGSGQRDSKAIELDHVELVVAPEKETELGVHLVTPSSFSAVQVVADAYSSEELVLVSLKAMSDTETRRVIDFCSGLVYGTSGQLRKLAKRLFLLQPASVDIDQQDIELMTEVAKSK